MAEAATVGVMETGLGNGVAVAAGRAVAVGGTVVAVGAAVGGTAVTVKTGWAGLVAWVKVTTMLGVLVLAAAWLELPDIGDPQPCNKPSSAINDMT